ncbi:MAG: hypothetical protein C4K48_04150 [Candidatus Thorarchaeota archaeon]|nr:MAG: hypothetical protein C4K48_04150 [Candidatus Thorarchaeota archaeon]
MEDKSELLTMLILQENISAIVILSERTGLKTDDVVDMINELMSKGRLKGTLTEDGSRFFKSSVKVSDARVIPREEKLPAFLSYNTKPGKVTAIVGLLILASGGIVTILATDLVEQNFAVLLILIGLVLLLLGLYFIARRGSPS